MAEEQVQEENSRQQGNRFRRFLIILALIAAVLVSLVFYRAELLARFQPNESDVAEVIEASGLI
ncbi:MAG TPA: hypothetical protein VF177_02950, partial [Anaerolineae bacterium]